jgi:hypothetical protein
MPAEQEVQAASSEIWPVAFPYVPSGQSPVQAAMPDTCPLVSFPNFPAGQPVHEDFPVPDWKRPATQRSGQLVVPSLAWKRPASQFVHADLPVCATKRPAAQLVHPVLPCSSW